MFIVWILLDVKIHFVNYFNFAIKQAIFWHLLFYSGNLKVEDYIVFNCVLNIYFNFHDEFCFNVSFYVFSILSLQKKKIKKLSKITDNAFQKKNARQSPWKCFVSILGIIFYLKTTVLPVSIQRP